MLRTLIVNTPQTPHQHTPNTDRQHAPNTDCQHAPNTDREHASGTNSRPCPKHCQHASETRYEQQQKCTQAVLDMNNNIVPKQF